MSSIPSTGARPTRLRRCPLPVRLVGLMLAAGFAALVVAQSPAVAAPASAVDSEVAGTWEGEYVCQQGPTGLTLTVSDNGSGAVTATFHFYPVSRNPGVADGSFEMRGSYSPPRLVLDPHEWTNQPPDYGMVSLDATFTEGSPDRISGRIPGDGCGAVDLVRTSEQPARSVTSLSRCDLAALQHSVGYLLMMPAALLGLALALFLMFVSRGRITGLIDAVIWAFGHRVRAIAVSVCLLSAIVGWLVMGAGDEVIAGCPT